MSRILNNSEEYRNKLISRNLYNPINEYDINNPNFIRAINFISTEIINPGNSFDFSNTIFGRIIGPQTPLSIIGRNELLKQKAYDVKSIIRTKLVPTIKFNSNFSGFKDLLSINQNVDYTITKNNATTPLEIFKNNISNFSSYYSTNNPITENFSFIDNYIHNNKLLIENTGDGQLFRLSGILSKNIFHPNYNIDIDTQFLLKNKQELYNNYNSFNSIKNNFNLTEFTIPVQIPPIDNNGNQATEYNSNIFNNENINNLGGITNINDIQDITQQKNITWGSIELDNKLVNVNYGLSLYTKNIFSQLGSKNTNNRTLPVILDKNGNNHYNGSIYNQNTSNNEYNYSKIRNPLGITNSKLEKSVLYNSMKPKVVGNGTENLMFSIENLATTYNSFKYPEEQRGRFGGRFMWFNPFIMNINETSTPDFNTTKFIGRSEPVYTFVGNERTLTISFKLLTDYDKNLLEINDYNSYTRYIHTNELITNNNNKNKPVTDLKLEKDIDEKVEQLTKNSFEYIYNKGFIIYNFNNDDYAISAINTIYVNNLLDLIDSIINYSELNENSKFKIYINSYSSINADSNYSINLAEQRSNNIKDFILWLIRTQRSENRDIIESISFDLLYEVEETQIGTINYDSPNAVSERSGYITNVELLTSITYNKNLNNNDLTEINKLNEQKNDIVDSTVDIQNDNVNQLITTRLNNNYNQLGLGGFSAIKNKIISPGLMSYSAKDMYDRLTFLNQCTRQGATIDSDPNTISNTVFGKPPVMVIRIGDMYFSKAILTQLTIDFADENNWDLNINDTGVQFMSCEVVISLKLIGGSTIDGPTKHILNGDSRSYYANSSFEENLIDSKYVDEEQKILNNL